jgi:hypothetical protein
MSAEDMQPDSKTYWIKLTEKKDKVQTITYKHCVTTSSELIYKFL